jgi:hypothetical protein
VARRRAGQARLIPCATCEFPWASLSSRTHSRGSDLSGAVAAWSRRGILGFRAWQGSGRAGGPMKKVARDSRQAGSVRAALTGLDWARSGKGPGSRCTRCWVSEPAFGRDAAPFLPTNGRHTTSSIA